MRGYRPASSRQHRLQLEVATFTACLSFLPGGHDRDVGLNFVLGFTLTMLVLGLVFAVAEQFRRRVAPT